MSPPWRANIHVVLRQTLTCFTSTCLQASDADETQIVAFYKVALVMQHGHSLSAAGQTKPCLEPAGQTKPHLEGGNNPPICVIKALASLIFSIGANAWST